MPATFAHVWLSRGALVAAGVFAYCAWLVFSMDRASKTNHVAVAFNLVFMIWAVGASFWYAAQDASSALALYKAFAWTWCVFPPLILHFTLRVARFRVFEGAGRLPFLAVLYTPALILSFVVPARVLADPVYRSGYWMLAIHAVPSYFIFVAHYLVMIALSVLIAFVQRARADDFRTRRRFTLLGYSYLSAVISGFITDTVILYAGLNVPNLGIFWVLILSAGMIVAMRRYGLLSYLPDGEALAVLRSMGEFVLYLGDSGRLVWCNASALSALGSRSLEEARALDASEFLMPELVALCKNRVLSAENSGVMELRTTFGREQIPVSLNVHELSGRDAEGVVITARDLRADYANARTAQRLADAGLLLDEFMSRSLDGIVMTDTSGNVVRWNKPMVAMTGISVGEALGKPYWTLRSIVEPAGGREPERVRKAIMAVLEGREPPWARHVLETTIVRTDGSKRIVQSDSFPIPMVEGTILVTIARDVTDERRLELEHIERVRKLDHAQKMEAVGTLSGGIAHDFNNTLAGILGAVSLLKADIENGIHRDISDLSGEIDIIERSAKRAASSVNRLLALTRKRSPENVAFRLDEAVDRVVQFARRSLDQSVAISLAEDMPIATVSGDAGQLEQLILNLVINAGHAMTVMRPAGHKPGGTIEVRLQSFHPDRAYLLANPAVEDRDYWVLSIRDEGVGIPRHLQNRIFDPFYTTKPGDVSSGLGLTMVHAIARQHRGFVELNSELGKGTEFFVYLPKASVEVACARQEPLGGVGQGLVLVADDDDIPRETIASMVEALGYTAVTASGGEEVLRMFSENPDDWKLAVLDFRMGDMDGDHVARTMRSIRQDLPVVLASGFHGDASDSAYGFETSFATLQKPFTLHELGKAIESVLARQR